MVPADPALIVMVEGLAAKVMLALWGDVPVPVEPPPPELPLPVEPPALLAAQLNLNFTPADRWFAMLGFPTAWRYAV